MVDKKSKTVQITVKIPENIYKSLQKLAAKNNQNMAEVVRKFIDKGLDVQSYTDNVDFISSIVRQEVKVEIKRQADRLAAMLFKVGAVSSSNYFLAVRMLADVISPSMQDDFKDINSTARQLGIDFMKLKGVDVVEFLKDDGKVEAAADKLKTDILGD